MATSIAQLKREAIEAAEKHAADLARLAREHAEHRVGKTAIQTGEAA